MSTAFDMDPEYVERAARGLILRWEHNPELFFREALRVRPWWKQTEIARSVDCNKRTIVRSSQKTGKTKVCSWIALWWCFTRANGVVVLTSPSEHQIKNQLWKEVRTTVREANRSGPLLIDSNHVALDPRTGIRLDDGREVYCVTTNEPEKMAGISGENLLYIVDEGSGYPIAQWDAIKGNLAAEGSRLLVVSNPTKPSGPYYDAFHYHQELWNTIHISALETPNVVQGRVVIPGLASLGWVQDAKKEWGEESEAYQVRVLGNFPGRGADAVVPLVVIDEAKERWNTIDQAEGRLDIGIDCARFGDDKSALVARRGRVAWVPKQENGAPCVVNGFDSGQVAGMARQFILSERTSSEHVVIKVDDSGGWGSGVIDKLKEWADAGELGENVTVIGINVSEVADDEEKYHAMRDQLWFGAADWLRTGTFSPDEKGLESDLLSPKYGFDNRARLLVEPKEKMKARLGRSPDIGDAFCLAVYNAQIGTGVAKSGGANDAQSRWGARPEELGY